MNKQQMPAAAGGVPGHKNGANPKRNGRRWRAALFTTTALMGIGLALAWPAAADQTIAGTTDVPQDVVTIVEPGVLTVSGTLNINNTGTVQTQDLDVDGGTVNVENGGTLTILGTKTTQNGGEVEVKTGGTLTAGTFNHQDIQIFVSGTMTTGDLTSAAGININNGGTYTVNGTATYVSAGTGAWQVGDSGSTLRITGILNHAADRRINAVSGGTITAESDVFVMGTARIEASGEGTINVMGALTVSDSARVEAFSTDAVFNAQGPVVIKDNGQIRVSATGTGAFNAFDTTTVNDNGELRVEGIYNASQPITLNGGLLRGGKGFNTDGLIVGDVINIGGTVGPDAFSGAGLLSVSGNYDQRAGGTFLTKVMANGDADQLAVAGFVKLAGNVTVNIVDPGMVAGTQVRILSASTAIEGMFDTGTLTGESIGALTAVVLKADTAGAQSDTGNNIDVLFVNSGGATDGLSGNQAAIAGALGRALPAGGIVVLNDTVMTAILAPTNPALLSQLSPEPYDSFTAFSFDVARQFGGLIDSRVRALRCSGSAAGPASGAFCGGGQNMFASDGRNTSQLADAGGRAGSGLKAADGAPSGTHPYGWSVWASGLGSRLSIDSNSSNLGYSGWTTGGVAGVDLALSRRFIIGVLAGATRSNIDFDGTSGDGDMDSVTTGVYAAWYGRRLFANAAFLYTKNWVEADRDITAMGTTANGKTEGDQYAVHATLGMSFKLRAFSLEATGGLDWVKLRQDGFTETGADAFNLSVNSRTDDSLRLRLGVRVSRVWQVRPGLAIAPNLRVGYAREVLDNTRPITATLTGVGGAFTVTGDEGGRDFVTYGAGVQAVWSQGVTLYVAYAGEWARDRTASSFSGGVRISW